MIKYIINKLMSSRLIRSIGIIFSSDILSLIRGLIVSLVIPRILSIEGYADYKIFTLYVSYIGLFHFGFLDGIAIKYAGITENKLDSKQIRMYTKLLFNILCLEALGVMSIAFLTGKCILCILIAIDIIIHNMYSYCSVYYQYTMQFKKYANVCNLTNITQLIGVIILYGIVQFFPVNGQGYLYILIFLFCELIALIIVLSYSWKILVGKSYRVFDNLEDIQNIIKLGFPLLMGGIITTIIFNLDRQFVQFLFLKEDYAHYAFAYSMINLVTVMVSAISIVIFPLLNNKSKNVIKEYYNTMVVIVIFTVFFVSSFCPLFTKFILWYLPQYIPSVHIFISILPSAVLISLIQIVLINYFKALKETKLFLFLSLFILIFSFILNILGFVLFKSMEAIAIATVVSCILWYLLDDYFIRKQLKIKENKTLYLLSIVCVYYIVFFNSFIQSDIILSLSFLALLLTLTKLFGKKEICKVLYILEKSNEL